MIFWLASYPKSGNTWIRSLISSYLFSKSGNFDFSLLKEIPRFPADKQFSPLIDLNDLSKDPLKITEYWHAAQLRLNLDNRIFAFFIFILVVLIIRGYSLIDKLRWRMTTWS